MSRLNDLIRQVGRKDEVLASDLQREVAALADRRSFGLNFERHVPEAVELPGRPVRRGDKVRILPPRGQARTAADERLWRVTRTSAGEAEVEVAPLDDDSDDARTTVTREDLVVVAEFRDPIYPGLVSTGTVERGGDKPFHTVINAENYHALQALLFTHRGKVDAIYIDPPYNSGARDWKYNNDYVEGDDLYRHSKWLAMMERRLLLAKELLNPDDSVLIVTIDEKEYLRLGLLLEQVLPDAKIQMISTVINPTGAVRGSSFARSDEYIFIASYGVTGAPRVSRSWSKDGHATSSAAPAEPYWRNLRRSGSNSLRSDRPNLYYALRVDPSTGRVSTDGPGDEVLPIRPDGKDGYWQVSAAALPSLLGAGFVRSRRHRGEWIIQYLATGEQAKVAAGDFVEEGREENGALVLRGVTADLTVATTQWATPSHSARHHGAVLLKALIGDRSFPFPKSLYAVEDVLRFFVADKPEATILDFFAGSGTTAHAAMRLNRQDGGRRRSISVTNNEVSADEQRTLRDGGYRPDDPDWEALGICEYVTKPRITAAITGRTPKGDLVTGDYKFTDEFQMADGLEENVEFFTLTYEAPLQVASHRAFERIAPLLWLRAGARGGRIDDVSDGWDVAETYGVLADLDGAGPFVEAVAGAPGLQLAFIVTDEDRLFEAVVRELPDHVEPVRLYESYLRTFELSTGGSTR